MAIWQLSKKRIVMWRGFAAALRLIVLVVAFDLGKAVASHRTPKVLVAGSSHRGAGLGPTGFLACENFWGCGGLGVYVMLKHFESLALR
jgi:hypothetical protein